MNEIAAVVLNYNDADNTISFVKSIESFSIIHHIVVVDNSSSDDSYERLIKCQNEKTAIIKTNENKGYACGNNYGIKYAIANYAAEFILVSNPDVSFPEPVLVKMLDVLNARKDIGQIAPVMESPRNRPENIAWKLPTYFDDLVELFIPYKRIMNKKYLSKAQEICQGVKAVDVLSGAFFMIRRDVFGDAGLFDESTFLYGEENILAYKLKEKGYHNALLASETYIHQMEVSINKSISSQKIKFNYLYQSTVLYHKNYLRTGLIRNTIYYAAWQISKITKALICAAKFSKKK